MDQLKIPSKWIDAALGSPTKRPTLRISYFPAVITEIAGRFGISCETLIQSMQADLTQGVVVTPDRRPDRKGNPQFVVIGSRWRLGLRSQMGENSQQWLSIVHRIEKLSIPTGHVLVPLGETSFHPIWNEEPCELEEFASVLIAETNRVKSLNRPNRDKHFASQERLHGNLRKQFGALRLVLSTLRLRSKTEALSLQAIVADSSESPSIDHETDENDELEDRSLTLVVPKLPKGSNLDEGTLVEVSHPMTRPSNLKCRSRLNPNEFCNEIFHRSNVIWRMRLTRLGD